MTINVHQDYDDYADRDDEIEVARTHYSAVVTGPFARDAFDRIEYANTDRTCLHRMRGWSTDTVQRDPTTGRAWNYTTTAHGYCLMPKGHKGRHSTVVFYCDGCATTHRGSPASSNEDVAFCFLCTREWQDGWRTIGEPY